MSNPDEDHQSTTPSSFSNPSIDDDELVEGIIEGSGNMEDISITPSAFMCAFLF